MGVPPAKLHEKPESVTPAVLPPVRRAKRAVAQPRPLTPGPWPLFFDPVNQGRTAPQNGMKNRRGSCRLPSPTGDKIAGVTRSLRRFFDPVGMGVPPAKLHEKPESVLPPVRRAKRAASQPRPLTPGPWPRFFDPAFLFYGFRKGSLCTSTAWKKGELARYRAGFIGKPPTRTS